MKKLICILSVVFIFNNLALADDIEADDAPQAAVEVNLSPEEEYHAVHSKIEANRLAEIQKITDKRAQRRLELVTSPERSFPTVLLAIKKYLTTKNQSNIEIEVNQTSFAEHLNLHNQKIIEPTVLNVFSTDSIFIETSTLSCKARAYAHNPYRFLYAGQKLISSVMFVTFDCRDKSTTELVKLNKIEVLVKDFKPDAQNEGRAGLDNIGSFYVVPNIGDLKAN